MSERWPHQCPKHNFGKGDSGKIGGQGGQKTERESKMKGQKGKLQCKWEGSRHHATSQLTLILYAYLLLVRFFKISVKRQITYKWITEQVFKPSAKNGRTGC